MLGYAVGLRLWLTQPTRLRGYKVARLQDCSNDNGVIKGASGGVIDPDRHRAIRSQGVRGEPRSSPSALPRVCWYQQKSHLRHKLRISIAH